MSDKVNRGKQFEEQVRKGFEKVVGVSIDRLHDQMSGFAGSSNICDFIVYQKPYEYYIECKCCYGNTLNFHNISDNQWRGLTEKSKIDGVIAGVMIWFIDHDYTTFIPIQALNYHKNAGEKSVNYNNICDYGMNDISVPGNKKRIFFDYDMLKWLNYIKWLDEFYPSMLGEVEQYE